MEINTNGILNSPLAPKPALPATQGGSASQPDVSSQSASGYTPSAEWLFLLDQLKKQPEIRENRVAAASERLRQGYYATDPSAMATAESIMNSMD